MSRSIISLPKAGSAGFTLVEALVSLAVLAIVLAAVGALAASSIRSALYVESHLGEVETAQTIIAALPGRNEFALESMTGEIADYRWQIDAKPYAASFIDPRAPTVWSPREIVVEIVDGRGALLRFDTIRLVRRAAK